jgi:hypothetical protein
MGQRDPLLTIVKDGLEKGMSALPADWEATGFFPEAKQGALGTCAVVATGDNLMQSPLRGEEIDAHDTVIRYNSPMKGYEQGVRRVLPLCPPVDQALTLQRGPCARRSKLNVANGPSAQFGSGESEFSLGLSERFAVKKRVSSSNDFSVSASTRGVAAGARVVWVAESMRDSISARAVSLSLSLSLSLTRVALWKPRTVGE